MAIAATLSACAKSEIADKDVEVQKAETPTVTGQVQLLYMGQASIRIVTEQDKVIYIDPYAGRSDWYIPSADLILITHEHFDHTAVSKIENRQPTCRIIRAKDAVMDGEHQIFDFGYVTVEAVEAGYNRYHDVRQCAGYVLTFLNGKKVYVSGDTSTTQQMNRMSEMNIDYAFLCTDGLYNMDNDEAARVAELIGARHNIPYHNDTSNSGEMFDRDKAERWNAPNKLVVMPGETIIL